MSEARISVVINTYNARQHLAKVLESVKDFDEVVVCDMESTDDTVAIAEQYGCKVVTFPKANHTCCEPARTFAIQSASNPWVLVVDADEIVTPQLREALYRIVRGARGWASPESSTCPPDCPAGYFIPRQNMFMNMFVRDFHYDYQLRFLIREGTEWPPTIHSLPKVPGRVEKLKAPKEARLLHLMDETMHEYVAKMNVYTDNETEKKQYGVAALFWRPLWRFFKNYVMDGSFRMGIRGLIRSGMHAVYQFILIAKIIEKRYRG